MTTNSETLKVLTARAYGRTGLHAATMADYLDTRLMDIMRRTVRACAAKYHADITDADVEDCVQDAAIKALETFDAAKGCADDHAKVCAWQSAIDSLRRSTVRRAGFHVTEATSDDITVNVYDTLASDSSGADDALAAREAMRAVAAFRATLSAKDAAMLDVLLDAGDAFDCHAYAAMTGERVGTVKTRLSRLRATLREWYATEA